MRSSWPLRLRALLSFVGILLVFLGLPLTWRAAQIIRYPLGRPVTEARSTQTTWGLLSGIFLQKDAGVLGPALLGVAFLTLLGLLVLGISAWFKRPVRRLSAGGVAVSSIWLGLSLLVSCSTLFSPSISFGPGTTTVSFGPGFWLPPVGLVLAATGMIMLHRRILAEEREAAYTPSATA